MVEVITGQCFWCVCSDTGVKFPPNLLISIAFASLGTIGLCILLWVVYKLYQFCSHLRRNGGLSRLLLELRKSSRGKTATANGEIPTTGLGHNHMPRRRSSAHLIATTSSQIDPGYSARRRQGQDSEAEKGSLNNSS